MSRLAALPALSLLAACVVKPTPAHELAGSEWQFVAIDEIVLADAGSLRFDGEELSADIGCNSMDGGWRVEDGRLIAGPLESTEIACLDSALFEQERALSALLVAAPKMDLKQDRLVLRSSGHSAELRRVDSPRRTS